MAKLKFDREATIARLFAPIPEPTDDSLIGVMKQIGNDMEIMRQALQHIANTSNNYESKYAKQILEKLQKNY